MHKIPQKPLSVNEAYQGRRFRTKKYLQFTQRVQALLTKLRPRKPPEGEKYAHYQWGVSNNGADIDNPTKTFQDVLFDFWGIKTKDHTINFMVLEKHKVKKGKEFIGFKVGSRQQLIKYLKQLVKRLEKEEEHVSRKTGNTN